jgi:hypothetical protein
LEHRRNIAEIDHFEAGAENAKIQAENAEQDRRSTQRTTIEGVERTSRDAALEAEDKQYDRELEDFNRRYGTEITPEHLDRWRDDPRYMPIGSKNSRGEEGQGQIPPELRSGAPWGPASAPGVLKGFSVGYADEREKKAVADLIGTPDTDPASPTHGKLQGGLAGGRDTRRGVIQTEADANYQAGLAEMNVDHEYTDPSAAELANGAPPADEQVMGDIDSGKLKVYDYFRYDGATLRLTRKLLDAWNALKALQTTDPAYDAAKLKVQQAAAEATLGI